MRACQQFIRFCCIGLTIMWLPLFGQSPDPDTPAAGSVSGDAISLPPETASHANPRNLESWINALAVAESGNRSWLIHRDRNGQLYYGCLQFHERTFRAYARKFHLLPNMKRSEAMALIYDCEFQKRLATLMIEDDPGNWRHWKGTVRKRVGLPPAPPELREPEPHEAEPHDAEPESRPLAREQREP